MSSRQFLRVLAAVAVASSLIAGTSPAYGRTALPKPTVLSHPDRAPSISGIAETQPRTSSMLADPDAAAVPLGTVSNLISGKTSGTNMITFGNFDDGDIVVVEDPSGITGHAGLLDHRFYVDIRSYAMLSANVSPANGVQREQCLKYRANDQAWGLWVPKATAFAVAARNFAYSQMGKPYNILGAKTDLRSFYCSKLVWAAWRYTSGLDLDADGGYWVWPIDLVNSRNTRVFGYWS
jgi:hypothetical protein